MADLDAAGMGGWDTYWSVLHDPPDEALPILVAALTRPDLPDDVREGVAGAFAARQARPYWDRLVAIWRSLAADPNSEGTFDRLAASLSDLAGREHLDDVLAILRSPGLGTKRIFFLRTLTRLRYADRWTVIEEAVRDPDLTVEASHLLNERAKRKAKRSR
jgi:hypothetical protein